MARCKSCFARDRATSVFVAGAQSMPILKKTSVLICVAILSVPVVAAPAATEKPSELARVAILEFNDNTGQANYGWVKKSLPDAINDSMKSHFEFFRADSAEAEKNAGKILGYSKEYSPEMISQVAKQYNFDIIIFGDYNYDPKTKLAKISASVYHREGKRIIGSVVEQTKLNNDVFTKIEVISKKIVEHIYRFSLDLGESEAARKREEGIRLLVLVPTWKDEAGKKTAINELEVQKKELKKRYQAEFLTIFEFFKLKNTPPADQKSIEALAKARNDGAIADWLKAQKVTNAMIVFVSENKVSLRPVIEGAAKAPVTYAVNAPATEKAKLIDSAVTTSGMKENLQKTAIMKQPGIWGRFSLAAGGFYLKPAGTGSDSINTSYGYELQALYRFVNLWLFQLGAAASLQGTTQKHTRSDGDPDFTLSHYAGMAGPAIIVPMPFYRALEFQFSILGGGLYSRLDKYKYIDTTVTQQAFNPVAGAQAELRWHIVRGLFVGAGAGYQQVFYPGTDMQFITINLRAGYRF